MFVDHIIQNTNNEVEKRIPYVYKNYFPKSFKKHNKCIKNC